MSVHSDFVSKTRQLASEFILAADAFNARVAELTYTDMAKGFSEDAFVGENADLDAAKILAFYTALGGLLAALTPEHKVAIYAVKN